MNLQHNPNNIVIKGTPLETAKRAIVMLHGRGASARDILSLTDYLEGADYAYVAPQATQSTWYPHSFMAPTEANEPGLSSALEVVGKIVARLHDEFGFAHENIFLLGFSQGACLSLEYVARNPLRFGGVFGLSGGLIGPENQLPDYAGDLQQTPVFLGCSDVDPHIPKVRVLESEQVFKGLNANVVTKLYKNFPHSVNDDELEIVNQVLTTTVF
ncbi:phospholipase/carboxylesterase [Persicitalea jodogahamensis]|uniref:Phospholipase/carboxylesterase n=2 Tax=Persicitalea jodogahamensis TaxID=402147 RepID=A0A8J3GBM3_9BACT|nr:phospholipase/carboxylesterase [Persicitalea jodogahamensis]